MRNTVSQQQPHEPLEDWLPALRHTQLEGSLYWVTNEEGLIVDATPDIADAAGMPISSYIGSRADAIADQIVEPPIEVRSARREQLFREGGSNTITLWGDLSGRGWTVVVATSTRITHPDTGRHYLVNAAHDVTDLQDQLDYLRAPAFQGLIMLIIENDGKVLAATDAAATFCNPALNRGDELKGATIEQTEFTDLKEREAAELALSWETGQPSQAIEWLVNGAGDYRPYAVTRVGFPKGRWMIVMMPVPLTEPYLQLNAERALEAHNLRQLNRKTMSLKQFQTLVDIRGGLELKEAGKRRGIHWKTVSGHRDRLADTLGVDSTRKILLALKHTELGYLATIYSQLIDEDPDDSP